MKTCVCVIVNNDTQYLKEFIDYYLNIGFDHIFLYETENSISHNDIVISYKDTVSLTRITKLNIDIKNHWTHQYLYNYFIDTYKIKYDWCLFLDDISAFIMFSDGYDLCSLTENNNVKAYILRWKIFNASGKILNTYEGTLIDNYTIQTFEYEKINDSKVYNSFVHLSVLDDTDRFNHKFTNFLETDKTYDAINNRSIKDEKYILYNKNEIKKCWLNVYYTKSWKDWCERIYTYMQTDERLIKNYNMSLDTFFDLNKDLEDIDEFLIFNEIHFRYSGMVLKVCSRYVKDYVLSYKYDGLNKYVDRDNIKIIQQYVGFRSQQHKTAILFLGGTINKTSIIHYNYIKDSIAGSEYDDHLYWAIGDDVDMSEVSINTNKIKFYKFNYDVLKEKYGKLHYWAKNELFNTNLVIQDFSDNYNEYEYIWLVEYDVIMSKYDWLSFFRYFENNESDLLSSNIRILETNGFNFNKDVGPYVSNINHKNWKNIQSFNTVMRMSYKACQYMSDFYKRGGEGFFEFTVPTILYNNGFKIEDFGGEGPFVDKKNVNKWYISGTYGNTGSNSFIRFPYDIIKNLMKTDRNIIIHPIKDIIK